MSEYIITTEQLNWFLERIDETDVIPSAIVLTHLKPIVRCKDCVWAKPDQSDHEFRGILCNMWIADVSADGFCSRGKRKQ